MGCIDLPALFLKPKSPVEFKSLNIRSRYWCAHARHVQRDERMLNKRPDESPCRPYPAFVAGAVKDDVMPVVSLVDRTGKNLPLALPSNRRAWVAALSYVTFDKLNDSAIRDDHCRTSSSALNAATISALVAVLDSGVILPPRSPWIDSRFSFTAESN